VKKQKQSIVSKSSSFLNYANWPIWAKKIVQWAWKLSLGFFVFSIFIVLLYRFVPVPITPLMIQHSLVNKWDGKPMAWSKEWVPYNDISENLVLAVVCSEDQNFEDHNGFDFEAIEKAIESNKKLRKRGRPVRGASTISQQVAKNVFLWPSRTWIRKGFEVYFTLLIEIFWSKERIMEVYLNVIEMGDNIYGAQAASFIYFNKNAKELRPREAAMIAAVLPNPVKFLVKAPTPYINKKQAWILRQMNAWGGSIDLNKADEN
jgi:monofunctional biosynthetic peptidoglycan transglycosylase